jgi:hypothetical protein
MLHSHLLNRLSTHREPLARENEMVLKAALCPCETLPESKSSLQYSPTCCRSSLGFSGKLHTPVLIGVSESVRDIGAFYNLMPPEEAAWVNVGVERECTRQAAILRTTRISTGVDNDGCVGVSVAGMRRWLHLADLSRTLLKTSGVVAIVTAHWQH